jgi:MFS family permease
VVFYIAPVHGPFLLEEMGAPGAVASGLAVALLMLFFGAGSLMATPAWKGLHREVLSGLACILIGAGYVSIALQRRWSGALPGLALAGVGLGLIIPNAFAFAAGRTPREVRGRAMGGLTAALFLGQFLSPIICAPVVSAWGLRPTFGLAGALTLATGAVFLLGGLGHRWFHPRRAARI